MSTEDQLRTCAALARLGYAQLAAEARGEADRAPVLLELFQQLYGQYRPTVTSCLGVDPSRVPAAPRVGAGFTASRDALLFAIATATPREQLEALLAMPTSRDALSGWLATFPASADLRGYDTEFARFTGDQLLDEASDQLFHDIEGGPSTPVALPAAERMFAPERRSYPTTAVDLAASVRRARLYRAIGAGLVGAALGLAAVRFILLRWA